MAGPRKENQMDRQTCDRMFVAVLDTGSFAAAAQRMGVSSGQASRLVSRLEAELGVQLMKRTTRALSPTDVGQVYYQRMKALLEEHDLLDAAVRNASGTPAGPLRITAPMTFGTRCLAPVLMGFMRRYPAIRLDVSFTDRLVNLVDDGFDVAVRVGRLEDSSLMARRLCPARIVAVAAPAYLARHGIPASPPDLAGHDCIIDTNFREPLVWRFADPATGAPWPVAVNGRLRLSNGEACLLAAEEGLGIAYVPSFIAGPSLRAGRVRVLLGAARAAPHDVHALYPPARHLALKVRALIDCLVADFAGTPPWDLGW
jgi:DNA-binding transcriptional LysR family regulator